MIALDQEEDKVHDLTARTKVYDWMEQRSRPRAESRKIQWRNGLGRKVKDNDGQHSTKDEDTSACEVDSQSDTQAAPVESESLHNALLRTLHHIGDSRLLTEYFRAQKEDFQGFVEVEKCTTPEKQRQLSPDPKKTVSPAPAEEERDKEIEKPANFSSAKLQAGRVATPIPQFPVVQRASNISSSYRHHTLPQPIYPQPHTQPIKMTPYAPSPTYIYQYAMDRPQGGIYTTPSPTSIPYGVANTEVTPRDYASTLTLNHMDSLNMNRRGLNHFQPETYNTSLHLPMQQIGFNYGAYYPASIQSLPQQNVPTIPLHQQYPLIQTPVMTQHPIPSDVSQLETYQHEYSPYPILSNLGQETVCMPPPLNPVRRPTPLATPPAALRQAAVSHQPVPPSIDTRMSVNPVVHHVPRSPALDFPPNFVHRQNHHHDQFLTFPSCRPHPQSNRDQSSSPPFKYSMTGHGRNKSFSPCKKERDDSSLYNCDAVNKSSVCNNECMPKPLGSIRTNSESSDISDLLHSAHSTMYQIDGMNSMENIREFHQAPTSVSDPTVRDTSPSKINILGHTSFNASYSVSSILDKRNCKVKLEPEPKMCSVSQLSNVWSGVYQNVVGHPQSAFVCFASAGSVGGSGSKEASNRPPSSNMHTKSNIHVHHNSSSSSNQSVKREGNPEKIKTPGVIVIEDTDDSSDDEPLARLVKAKSMELPGGRASEAQNTDSNKTTNISKLKSSTLHIPKHQSKIRTKQMEQISDQIKPVDLVKVEKFTSVTLQSTGTTKHAQPQSTGTAKLVQPQSTGTAKSVHSQSTMTANHVESQSTGTAKHIEPQNTGTAKSVHSQSTGTAKRVESPSTETAKDLELQCTEDVKHVELQSTATVKQYVEPQNIGTSKHIEPQSIVTAKHVEPQSIGTAKRVEPQSTGTVKHVEPHSIQTIKRVEPQNTGTAKRVESQSTGAAKRVEPQNTGTAKRVESQSTGATKRVALKSQDGNTFTESHAKPQLEEKTNESLCRPQNSVRDKIHSDKETKQKSVPKKTAISNSSKTKKSAKKVKVAQPVWPLTPTKVNTNHGWSWASDGQMRLIPKITQSREEQVRIRKCYQSMRHTSGETVSIRDCVILQSDGDGSIPFVGKVSALWESLSGEMMFSMLWYYQPEHTATGREPDDGEQELFASKHREENSVACIDDKCFVLMYNAYCRLEAEGARHEQMVPVPKWRELIPEVTEEDKKYCRLPPPANACADNIWFCRYDYDIRKKVVKKPKHKKSNLRYRAPCKPV